MPVIWLYLPVWFNNRSLHWLCCFICPPGDRSGSARTRERGWHGEDRRWGLYARIRRGQHRLHQTDTAMAGTAVPFHAVSETNRTRAGNSAIWRRRCDTDGGVNGRRVVDHVFGLLPLRGECAQVAGATGGGEAGASGPGAVWPGIWGVFPAGRQTQGQCSLVSRSSPIIFYQIYSALILILSFDDSVFPSYFNDPCLLYFHLLIFLFVIIKSFGFLRCCFVLISLFRQIFIYFIWFFTTVLFVF